MKTTKKGYNMRREMFCRKTLLNGRIYQQEDIWFTLKFDEW